MDQPAGDDTTDEITLKPILFRDEEAVDPPSA